MTDLRAGSLGGDRFHAVAIVSLIEPGPSLVGETSSPTPCVSSSAAPDGSLAAWARASSGQSSHQPRSSRPLSTWQSDRANSSGLNASQDVEAYRRDSAARRTITRSGLLRGGTWLCRAPGSAWSVRSSTMVAAGPRPSGKPADRSARCPLGRKSDSWPRLLTGSAACMATPRALGSPLALKGDGAGGWRGSTARACWLPHWAPRQQRRRDLAW